MFMACQTQTALPHMLYWLRQKNVATGYNGESSFAFLLEEIFYEAC